MVLLTSEINAQIERMKKEFQKKFPDEFKLGKYTTKIFLWNDRDFGINIVSYSDIKSKMVAYQKSGFKICINGKLQNKIEGTISLKY